MELVLFVQRWGYASAKLLSTTEILIPQIPSMELKTLLELGVLLMLPARY